MIPKVGSYSPLSRPKTETAFDPSGGFGPPPMQRRTVLSKVKLDQDIIHAIGDILAKGATQRDAAALAGISPSLLSKWISKGEQDSADGKDSPYARLYHETCQATAHYRSWLLEMGNRSAAGDRDINERWLKWRLATSAPRDFTIPSSAPGPKTAPEEGTGDTQILNPAECTASLVVKIQTFLSLQELDAAPAPEPEPTDE